MIVDVFPGSDGYIRSVNIKTAKGIFNRSIQRLYDLEINHCIDDNDLSIHTDTHVNKKSDEKVDDVVKESSSDVQIVNKMSKKGRNIKKPQKLDL